MNRTLKKLKYGEIELMVKYPLNKPTIEVFENWKKDFLKINETKLFNIYVTGSFREKLINDNIDSHDIDIILTGCNKSSKIEKLIYEGTKLGFEKYNTFFDILWFNKLPIYREMKVNTVQKVQIGLISPELTIDGVNQNPKYKWTKQIGKNLWTLPCAFPSRKQMRIIKNGYVYEKPMLIN
tara:strand:- start:403 stop:945 length:543 start_codon:yes stop_codon:yes gene_type:complete